MPEAFRDFTNLAINYKLSCGICYVFAFPEILRYLFCFLALFFLANQQSSLDNLPGLPRTPCYLSSNCPCYWPNLFLWTRKNFPSFQTVLLPLPRVNDICIPQPALPDEGGPMLREVHTSRYCSLRFESWFCHLLTRWPRASHFSEPQFHSI